MAQTVMAGTKVYVNFGIPAVNFVVRGGGPCDNDFRIEGSYYPEMVVPYHERVYVVREVAPRPEHIWIEGYYRWERPHRIWVPAHWERVSY
jgi:hypothetical protein